jgi:hypothetical protein
MSCQLSFISKKFHNVIRQLTVIEPEIPNRGIAQIPDERTRVYSDGGLSAMEPRRGPHPPAKMLGTILNPLRQR